MLGGLARSAVQITRNFTYSTSAARTISTMPSWTRLVRFVAAEDGKTYQGEPQLPQNDASFDLGLKYDGVKVNIISGDIYGDCTVTDEVKTIKKLLSPVSRDQITLVRCVGLNYVKHIQEGHLKGKIPEWPTEFIKGRSALANPDEPVFIPKYAQDSMDLEAELAIVIGKTGKDIKQSEATDYILGYTCGNDVSWRRAQQEYPYSGSQWCYGKGLDNFAPIGPMLVSPKAFDSSDVRVASRLNGQDFQEDRTEAMIHTVPRIIEHFSQGTTLEKGDVILTGTPQGVGYARNPPVILKHNDTVEIIVEGIGTLRHTIEFEQ